MYCIDSSILIEIFRGDKKLAERLNKLIASDEELYVAPITAMELFKGAFLHHNSKEKIEQVEELLNGLEIIEFNIDSYKEFGKMYSELKKKGVLIGEFDIMIASIAIANNLIIITKDKDFTRTTARVQVW